MPTEISTEIATWPTDTRALQNGFRALQEEEDRIVRHRGPGDSCYAYITPPESGEFGGWVEGTTESLQARFELLGTKAGLALDPPRGIPPLTYWLRSLFFDLRAIASHHIRMCNDAGGFIERLFEASAAYCARLDRRKLETFALSTDHPRVAAEAVLEPQARPEIVATQTGEEESVRERSARRSAVVLPILRGKKWSRGRWATQAGVGKNSVYEYLSGKRKLGIENRQALAEELGLQPQELPD